MSSSTGNKNDAAILYIMMLYIVFQLTGISEALSGQASAQPLGWLKMLTLDARLGSTKVAECFGGGVDGEASFLTVVILW